MLKCHFNIYCENLIKEGVEYHARGYKKDYGLVA